MSKKVKTSIKKFEKFLYLCLNVTITMKTLVSHTLNAKSTLVATSKKTLESLSTWLLNAVLGEFGRNIRNTKRKKGSNHGCIT